jgi:hypothetical protein
MEPEQIEIPLRGGRLARVVRIGNTVHRSVGPWTPAVHALLRHLEAKGFDAAPQLRGFDAQGREVLSFIPGATATRPWPVELRRDSGLRQFVTLLRRYHEAVQDFVPPDGAFWAAGSTPLKSGDIIRHGDFGPWNTIWLRGQPVGLIDFDLAEPGQPILDLAQAALFGVPLQGAQGIRLAGFSCRPNLHRRFLLLCRTYGKFGPSAVLAAVNSLVTSEIRRVETLGRAGREPWATLLKNGKAKEFRKYKSSVPSRVRLLRILYRLA